MENNWGKTMTVSFGNFFADSGNCPGMVAQAKANNSIPANNQVNNDSRDTYVKKSKKQKNLNVLRTLGTMAAVVGTAVAVYFGKGKIQKAVSGHKIDGHALGDNLKKAGSGLWGSVKEIFKVFKKQA